MATPTPVVSIIIPLYNREEIVKETLDSVLAQTYPHWECIIVDDISTDNSLATAKEYAARDSRFKVFQRDRKPKGAPTCRNIGLKNAEGEYVIFLDSDDLLAVFCLERRLEEFEKNLDSHFSVFQTRSLFGGTSQSDYNFTQPLDSYLIAFLSHEIPWTIMSVLWKRTTLIQLDGFNERLRRLQDVELHTRVLLITNVRYSVHWDSEPDSFYRRKNSKIKLVSGLSGFYNYLKIVYPNAKYVVGRSELERSFRSHLKHAGSFFVRNFQRKSAFRAYSILFRMHLFALTHKIFSIKEFLIWQVIFVRFILHSFVNLPNAQMRCLGYLLQE